MKGKLTMNPYIHLSRASNVYLKCFNPNSAIVSSILRRLLLGRLVLDHFDLFFNMTLGLSKVSLKIFSSLGDQHPMLPMCSILGIGKSDKS